MLSPFMRYFIRFLQSLLVPIIWPYSKLLSLRHKKKVVQPPQNPLLFHSAASLADMIRNQKVSSVEVMKAYIERIQTVNPIINSLVDERFRAAIEEAQKVDQMIKENPDPSYWAAAKPLLGVPISIKESIGVKGLSNNSGRCVPKSRIAEKDAVAVENIKNTGAIPVVVTNTPELCLFWETINYATGITKNPYDWRKAAGGSSGGECALIGAAGSVIGLGSDIVGSGRIPALFCGVFGHKPTPGLISVDGHMPVSEDPEWTTFLTLCPISRYAEDLPLIMAAAAPETTKILRLDQPVDVKKIKVYYMEEHKSILTNSVSGEIKAAIRRAAEHLGTKCEVKPQKVDFSEFDCALEAVCTLMLRMKSPQTIFQKSENVEDWTLCDVIAILFKRLFGCTKYTMHAICFGIIKKLAEALPPRSEEACRRFKSRWQAKFQELLGEDGVFILPVYTHLAAPHYQVYYKMTDSSYMSAFNLLEMAATACPMGLTKSGLPVGIQITACKNQDRLTFAIAKELESAFGGWVAPGNGGKTDV